MTTQDNWLRRSPWAFKVFVFLAVILVAQVGLRFLFGMGNGSPFASSGEILTYLELWAIATVPFYLGKVLWRLAEWVRGTP